MDFDMRETTMGGSNGHTISDSIAVEVIRQRDEAFKRILELERLVTELSIELDNSRENYDDLDTSHEYLVKLLAKQPIVLSEVELKNFEKFKNSNEGYYTSLTVSPTGIGLNITATFNDTKKDITDYGTW